MKKLLLYILFITVIPFFSSSNDFLSTLQSPLQFLSHTITPFFAKIDPMKVTTTILGLTVAVLCIDKFYPIFPTTRNSQKTVTTTNDITNIVIKEIQNFSNNIHNPGIALIDNRIDALIKSIEKIKYIEKDLIQVQSYLKNIPDIETIESLQRRIKAHEDALTGYVDAKNTLNLFKIDLQKYQLELNEYEKRADSINAYLELLNQRTPRNSWPGTSNVSSDDECSGFFLNEFGDPTSILPGIPEEGSGDGQKEIYIPPLNLSASANFHTDTSIPQSPTPYTYAANHTNHENM